MVTGIPKKPFRMRLGTVKNLDSTTLVIGNDKSKIV